VTCDRKDDTESSRCHPVCSSQRKRVKLGIVVPASNPVAPILFSVACPRVSPFDSRP
jgi:hypothetical protein